MYVGHFAIGLALKARFPKTPTFPLLIGVGVLDILDGLFVLLGIDLVTPDLNAGPYLYFDLKFIDWDHSFVAALFWALAFSGLYLRDKRVALLTFAAVFSHFLADWPVHNNDLALYPHSAYHLGLGGWGVLGTGAWILEGMFAAALTLEAYRSAARRRANWAWPCALMILLFANLSPWLSPMKHVATLSEPAAHLIHGALVLVGFLVPGLLLTWLVDRAEKRTRLD